MSLEAFKKEENVKSKDATHRAFRDPIARSDGRGMIAVFPECAVASFTLIVFLATAASDQLHAISDNLWTGISNQKVNVVAGHYVIKYGKTEALLRFEKPAQIRRPITRKLQ